MNIIFKFLNNLNLYKFFLNVPTGNFATIVAFQFHALSTSSLDLKVLYIIKTSRNAI